MISSHRHTVNKDVFFVFTFCQMRLFSLESRNVTSSQKCNVESIRFKMMLMSMLNIFPFSFCIKNKVR